MLVGSSYAAGECVVLDGAVVGIAACHHPAARRALADDQLEAVVGVSEIRACRHRVGARKRDVRDIVSHRLATRAGGAGTRGWGQLYGRVVGGRDAVGVVPDEAIVPAPDVTGVDAEVARHLLSEADHDFVGARRLHVRVDAVAAHEPRGIRRVESGHGSDQALVDLVWLHRLIAVEIGPPQVNSGRARRIERLGQLSAVTLIEVHRVRALDDVRGVPGEIVGKAYARSHGVPDRSGADLRDVQRRQQVEGCAVDSGLALEGVRRNVDGSHVVLLAVPSEADDGRHPLSRDTYPARRKSADRRRRA